MQFQETFTFFHNFFFVSDNFKFLFQILNEKNFVKQQKKKNQFSTFVTSLLKHSSSFHGCNGFQIYTRKLLQSSGFAKTLQKKEENKSNKGCKVFFSMPET